MHKGRRFEVLPLQESKSLGSPRNLPIPQHPVWVSWSPPGRITEHHLE